MNVKLLMKSLCVTGETQDCSACALPERFQAFQPTHIAQGWERFAHLVSSRTQVHSAIMCDCMP